MIVLGKKRLLLSQNILTMKIAVKKKVVFFNIKEKNLFILLLFMPENLFCKSLFII